MIDLYRVENVVACCVVCVVRFCFVLNYTLSVSLNVVFVSFGVLCCALMRLFCVVCVCLFVSGLIVVCLFCWFRCVCVGVFVCALVCVLVCVFVCAVWVVSCCSVLWLYLACLIVCLFGCVCVCLFGCLCACCVCWIDCLFVRLLVRVSIPAWPILI